MNEEIPVRERRQKVKHESPLSCLVSTCRTKVFSYLIGTNFSDSFFGYCALTSQSCHEYSLGAELSKKCDLQLVDFNMGRVDYESNRNTEYSILLDYQHKTMEACLSGRDLLTSALLELGKV